MLFGDKEAFLENSKHAGVDHFKREHTKPLFNKQKIMSMHNLYAYHCSMEVFKLLIFRSPLSVCNLLKLSIKKTGYLKGARGSEVDFHFFVVS